MHEPHYAYSRPGMKHGVHLWQLVIAPLCTSESSCVALATMLGVSINANLLRGVILRTQTASCHRKAILYGFSTIALEKVFNVNVPATSHG